VLFDVYGTLLTSGAGGEPALFEGPTVTSPAAAQAQWAQELRAAGWRGGPERFSRELRDEIAQWRAGRLEGGRHPEVDVEQMVSRLVPQGEPGTIRRLAVLHEAVANPCASMPGAQELLAAWARHPRLGLVSNAQFYTPLLIEALLGSPVEGLGFRPSLTVYSYQNGIAKPDPALFQQVLSVLHQEGVAPAEVLFVGNSAANDVAPPRVLGMMTALFAGDSRSFRPSAAEDTDGRPDTVVTRLLDLLPLGVG